MSYKTMLALIITLFLLSGLAIMIFALVKTPTVYKGYTIPPITLHNGDELEVTSLSPTVRQADVDITMKSTSIFILTGEHEIDSVPSQTRFTFSGTFPLSTWTVYEGDLIQTTITSKSPLRVDVYHRPSYYALPIMIVTIIFFFVWLYFINDIYH